MQKAKNSTGILAGVFILVYCVIPLLYSLIRALLAREVSGLRDLLPWYEVVALALFLVLSVLLMANVRSFAVALPAGLIGVFRLILDLFLAGGFSLSRILFWVSCLGWLFLAAVLVSSDRKAAELRKGMRAVFFLPVVLMLLREVYDLIRDILWLVRMDLYYYDGNPILDMLFYYLLPLIALLIGVFFAGRWAVQEPESAPAAGFSGPKAPIPNFSPAPGLAPRPGFTPNPGFSARPGYSPTPAYNPGRAYPPVRPQQPNGAPPPLSEEVKATLRNYKQLLDAGIISQAEFDAKTRELLG